MLAQSRDDLFFRSQDKPAPCPLDHVNRVFHAPVPNMLWLSEFTYISTWSGFIYMAFVIDAPARTCELRARYSQIVRGTLPHHARRAAHG